MFDSVQKRRLPLEANGHPRSHVSFCKSLGPALQTTRMPHRRHRSCARSVRHTTRGPRLPNELCDLTFQNLCLLCLDHEGPGCRDVPNTASSHRWHNPETCVRHPSCRFPLPKPRTRRHQSMPVSPTWSSLRCFWRCSTRTHQAKTCCAPPCQWTACHEAWAQRRFCIAPMTSATWAPSVDLADGTHHV